MKTAVIGASGYAGGELLRLLSGHEVFNVEVITAFSQVGELVTSIHPHLSNYEGQLFTSGTPDELRDCQLIFLALPHSESSRIVASLPEEARVIDLGADFRLESSHSWTTYYGGNHPGTWTYGLPELPGGRIEISQSQKISNPGCYATSIALATAPALRHIDATDVVIVAASGTTGAGRSAKINLLASEVMGSLTSYKFGGAHQHTPEIEESLSRVLSGPVKVSFTPILAPMPRGILSTVTSKLISKITEDELREIFINAYKNEHFVRVLPKGQMPKTSSVLGSNYVHIQIAIDSHTNRVVISCAIDNLGKGAAGQAIQNANIVCGLNETMGLEHFGVGV
ncbi:unannotated protein [freshwater metagenome]|uniref:N-acetyl-gamma-glutamyl-phosphate reductase n=1 Tax=freshwater metagenome TaxID=449393 RepID=A0A6J7XZV7_9ZZZZ|nr:N-acetyl-gamma-glutamyl-phosphate reductase [Actinomycetota bacterium]